MSHLTKIAGLLLACAVFLANAARAQTPAPSLVIVQAANSPAATPSPALPAQDLVAIRTAVKSLQQIKTANEETLKKQEAALQQLEEMQKAAQQLKIFTHRSGG